MIITNQTYENMFNSVAREFVGRVELLEGSTLVRTFEHDNELISFTVEKPGNNTKFFGYGICQKATVKLRDRERAITITKDQGLQIAHGIKNNYLYTYPIFYVDEVTRDENTNELTIVAYDAIYQASKYKVKDLELPETYTLREFAVACAGKLGMSIAFSNISYILLDVEYTEENYANFSGEESLREAIDDVAEMFGAIYYMSNNWELTFQQLNINAAPVQTIDKSKYFDLKVKSAHTLKSIASVTSLGDNVESVSSTGGTDTAYLSENPFLSLRNDIYILLDNIVSFVGGLTIVQFECKHRGDFRVELGDKVALTTKNGDTIMSYVVDDTITYNGGLSGISRLAYSPSKGETATNPSTLGEALKQTIAKVDKTNGQITILAERTQGLDKQVASLQITSDNITQSVSRIDAEIDGLDAEVERLSTSVSLTPEDVRIIVEESIQGVNEVTTTTGFVFDKDGLSIGKTGSDTATKVTPNGMYVHDSHGTLLLQANDKGVFAKDLGATTYLTVASSRFEDYVVDGVKRTGCFWIGGIN